MTWRKKWAKNWGEVKYCSDACRRCGVRDEDVELERAILELLSKRARGASICPSEAARAVRHEGWRELMEPARRAARRLVRGGRVEITQHDKIVDPTTAIGPIRIRLTRHDGTIT